MNYWLTVVGCPIIGGIIIVEAALLAFAHTQVALNIVFALFGIFMLWRPFAYRRCVRKLYGQQKFDEPLVCSASDRGMRFQRRDGSLESTLTWAALDKYIGNADYFVLFLNVASFIPIPKRALNAQQLETLSAILSAHVLGK